MANSRSNHQERIHGCHGAKFSVKAGQGGVVHGLGVVERPVGMVSPERGAGIPNEL